MSSKSFTSLKPVILGNDDYDESTVNQAYCPTSEETAVKQVYSPENSCSSIECGQRVTSLLNINVTPRNLVNVTQENVSSLFTEITEDTTNMHVPSQNVQNVLQLYRQLPKDMFLNQIISDYHSDEMELKELRNTLFSEIKCLAEFPFPIGSELKRRKKPKIGESTALKLCNDIYVLASIFEGAPFDDMKELLSISKQNYDNTQNETICIDSSDTNTSCSHDSDIALFRSMLTTIQADLFSLKHENKSLREDYQKELKSIKADVILLKTDITESIDKLQETATDCKQVVDRVTDERYNGVTRVKNDLKIMQFDIKLLNDNLDSKCQDLTNKFSLVPKLEKRLSKFEQKLANSKEPSSDYVNTHKPACGSNIQTPEGSDAGTGGSPQLVAEKIQSNYRLVCENNDSDFTSSLVQCPITHKLYRVKGNSTVDTGNSNPNAPIRPDTQSDSTVLKYPPTVCVSDATDTNANSTYNYFQDSSCDPSNGVHHSVINVPVSNRFEALHDDRVNSDLSYSEALKRPVQSSTESCNLPTASIPVRISERRKRNGKNNGQDPTLSSQEVRSKQDSSQAFGWSTGIEQGDGDGEFIKHIRRKSSRFYIGGFKPSITEMVLCSYVQRRGVHVSWINIRRYHDQDRAVIQLNVDADKGSRLLEDGFWPEEVVCRPWYPRNVFRQRNQRRSNWVETDTYDYAHEYNADDRNSLRNYTRNID